MENFMLIYCSKNHDGPCAGLVRKERESSLSVRTPVLKFHIRAVRAVQASLRHMPQRRPWNTRTPPHGHLRTPALSPAAREPARPRKTSPEPTGRPTLHVSTYLLLGKGIPERSLQALHFHLTQSASGFPHPAGTPAHPSHGHCRRAGTQQKRSFLAPRRETYSQWKHFHAPPPAIDPYESLGRERGGGEGTLLASCSLSSPPISFSLFPTSSQGKHR